METFRNLSYDPIYPPNFLVETPPSYVHVRIQSFIHPYIYWYLQ